MKQEVAKTWSEALRSGQYEQCTGYLKQAEGPGNAYCCLGVLCDLYHADTKQGRWQEDFFVAVPAEPYEPGSGHFSDTDLPTPVKEWAGMQTHDGQFASMAEVEFNTLIAMNDDAGATFMDIAELIDQKWEVL